MKLELIPKITTRQINLLNKLNIYSIEDLLEYYPYRYNYIKFINIDNTIDDTTTIYVLAKVLSVPKCAYIKRNFNKLEFLAQNNNATFKVVIFNRAYLKNNLTIDKQILLIGKYNKLKNTFTANDIKLKDFYEHIEPIYHLTFGLKNSTITSIINKAIDLNIPINDNIPEYINKKYNLISKSNSIKLIHNPNTANDIKQSNLKLIYEELFIYTFKINYLRQVNRNIQGLPKTFDREAINAFLGGLTFELTPDQILAIQSILTDMENTTRMNRLVLGDVGSGKTIVAIVALLANYLSSYQGTFMAPTEILAEQHYNTLINYFIGYDINIKLLTSSTKKSEKEKIYEGVLNGSIDILIGTHSLLNESLIFKNLGLVITDEQHRFGVKARNLLTNKGSKCIPDALYLSATPIPRTYALTIYGDLDLSQIKTKPNKRLEIITKVVQESNIKEVLLKMLEELKLNHQIFVVSPLIEQNDELNLNSVNELKDKLNRAFNNNVRIEILHGKLKQTEKDTLMDEFKQGNIKILISTTVIEVGIDIPNASMIVIFNSERFGLATLHQLRGRVGRSDIQSYCYLITKDEDNKRLKVMEESTDGFYIAEEDFKQRGSGDLFGVRQSGDMSFKVADFKRDYKILNQANLDSREFLESNSYKNNDFYKEIIKNINFLD